MRIFKAWRLRHSIFAVLLLAIAVGQDGCARASTRNRGSTRARPEARGRTNDLADLLARLVTVVAAMNASGYNVVHIEVDKLRAGETASLTRHLYSTNRYAVYGVGARQVADLDLCVYNAGARLRCDTSPDNIPIVEFKPPFDRPYDIRTTLYELNDNTSSDQEHFYCWVLGFK